MGTYKIGVNEHSYKRYWLVGRRASIIFVLLQKCEWCLHIIGCREFRDSQFVFFISLIWETIFFILMVAAKFLRPVEVQLWQE